MLGLMLLVLLVAAASALIGAISGLLVVCWYVKQLGSGRSDSVEPADPFVSAEIDQAAAAWAHAHGRPEAARLMADKLHLLDALGRQRRRS
jgi:hypothetical protein